jgi:UTP--glucose-1-phosphate uridylyltransferase
MAQTIRKVVIPAAGFGTRFLPATKAQPKEMMPVVDKPIIQYVVEEAVQSGILDIIIVTGASKRAIEDHFDYNHELQHMLKKQRKEKLQQQIKQIADMANFIYIRQKGPYGNGTPVLNAKDVVGNEPFAVMWGDEFIYANPPRLAQMIEVYHKYGGVVISGIRIENKDSLKQYGIADIEPMENGIFKIKKIVEKPDPDKAPSNLALLGAYILPPEIFTELGQLQPGQGDEIWLTDAINRLQEKGVPLIACEIKNGKYYDCGNKLEYLKTNIDFALQHEEIGPQLRVFLQEKLQEK